MLLDLAIICDALSGLGARLVGEPGRRCLSGVRLLRPGQGLRDDLCYVADAAALAGCGENMPRHLVFIGDEGGVPAGEGGLRAVVRGTADAIRVLDEVQAAFERYGAWESRVLTSIARGRPLQETFDVCVSVLANPVALFDVSESLLLWAGEAPTTSKASIWDDVLTHGYVLDERLSPSERRFVEDMWKSSDEPYVFHPEAFPEETQLVAVVRRGGRPIGNLGSVDICAPFTAGQRSLYAAMRDLMELAIEARGQDEGMADSTIPVLGRFVAGDLAVMDESVTHMLAARGWHADDYFCACYVVSEGHAPMNERTLAVCSERLMRTARPAFVVPHAHGLVVVFRLRGASGGADCGERVLPALKNTDLVCGVSLPARGILTLHRLAEQARLAVHFARHSSETRIYRIQENYARGVVGTLGQSLSLEVLCHPAVMAMWQGGEAGRERVETLRTHLVSGKNVAETARRMNIHRNSLVYRLGRIEDELGLSFASLDADMTLMLLLSCLIVEAS